MSGTWPLARAAIAAQLNGVTADAGADFATETLSVFDGGYAPPGRQPVDKWPYAFVMSDGTRVGRGPSSYREIAIAPVVRVMLAPMGESLDMNALQRRYDAWVVALMDAWDDAATLDGAADISVEQAFGGLAQFDDIDRGWGFDMELPNVRISEAKEFSA